MFPMGWIALCGPSGTAWGQDSLGITSGGIGTASPLSGITFLSRSCSMIIGEAIRLWGDWDALLLVATEVDLLHRTCVPVRGWYQYCESSPGSGKGFGFSS